MPSRPANTVWWSHGVVGATGNFRKRWSVPLVCTAPYQRRVADYRDGACWFESDWNAEMPPLASRATSTSGLPVVGNVRTLHEATIDTCRR